MLGKYISDKLDRNMKKRLYLSFSDHTFDVIYCQWNTSEPGAFHVSFPMFYYVNSTAMAKLEWTPSYFTIYYQ